jgi:hypothetical protein
LVQAVGYVATAIVRVGGSDGRALVERAARDPLTQPEVVKELSNITGESGSEAARAGSR